MQAVLSFNEGEVITGLNKDITSHSATLRGYISPEITVGLNGKDADIEYGIIVKGGGKSYTYKKTNEQGGIIEYDIVGLSPSTDYVYFTYIWNRTDALLRFGEEKSFTTKPCLPQITNFEQLSVEYKYNAFSNNEKTYSYRFHCATTVEIDDLENVEDWGYVYVDREYGEAELPLMGFGNSCRDARYAYYRNNSKDYVTFYTYVKYKTEKAKVPNATKKIRVSSDDGYYYSEPIIFDLVYEQRTEVSTLETVMSDETMAKVKCRFVDFAAWNGICGVEYWCDDNHLQKTIELTDDGEAEIELTGLCPVRPYNYRAFIKIGDEYHWAEETKSFGTFQEIEHICPDENHPHVIDLELPSGTKWLCSNVGAISPNGYGRYYAWGETYEKGSYVRSSHFGSAVISDNHDVAYVQSGGEYRMPSRSQIQELMSECSWEWQSHDGVMGAMVTRKGHSIFLPASSFRDDEVPGPAKGLYGSYWGRDFGGVRQWGSNNVLCGTELIFGLLDGNAGFTPSNFYYTYGNTGWVYCGRSERPMMLPALNGEVRGGCRHTQTLRN